MADEDFWREVGRLLREARADKGWKYPTDVYEAGGPHNTIVKQHERGQFRTFSSLADHARVLEVSVADVLRAAMNRTGASPGTVASPSAQRFARQFDELPAGSRELVKQLVQRLRVPKQS